MPRGSTAVLPSAPNTTTNREYPLLVLVVPNVNDDDEEENTEIDEKNHDEYYIC